MSRLLSTLSLYLASRFIRPFLLSTFSLLIFLLVIQSFRLIRIMTSKEIEWAIIGELIGHIALSLCPLVVPLATLVAMIYTMSRLTEDSEIVAMRSFGLTKRNLLAPFFWLGLLITMILFTLNDHWIPYSKKMVRNTIHQMASKAWLSNIGESRFFTEIPRMILFSEKISLNGDILENIFIQILKEEGEKIVFAKKGILIKQGDGNIFNTRTRLVLVDGHIIKILKTGSIEKILFDEYDFPIFSIEDFPYYIITRDNMRSNRELKEVIAQTKVKLKKNYHRDTLTALYRSQLEYWMRWSTSLSVLLFILFGFVLGPKRVREGSKYGPEAMGLIVAISYYVLSFSGISLSKEGHLNPLIAAFAPISIMALVGAWLYKKIE